MNNKGVSTKRRWILIAVLAVASAVGTGLLVSAFPVPLLWLATVLLVPFVLWLAKRPDTLFLFWLVASPLFREYFNFSGGGLPNITLDRILLLSLTGWMILEGAGMILEGAGQRRTGNGKQRQPDVFLFVLLGLYLGTELIGYVRSVWPIATSVQYYLDRAVLPIFAFWLTRRFVISHGIAFVHSVSHGLIGVGVYSVVLEVLRRYAGIEMWLYPNGRTYIWDDVIGSRAVGEFYNPMIFGGIVVLSFSILLYTRGSNLNSKIRWIIGVACRWAIVMTFTRAVWLSFAAVLLLLIFLNRGRLPRIVSIVFGVFVLLTALVWIAPDTWNSITDRLTEQSNVTGRQNLALLSVQMFLAKPLFGWGAGTFDATHSGSEMDIASHTLRLTGSVSHNSFLLMLADRGLVVFLPYMAAILYLVYRSIRLYRNDDKVVRRVAMSIVWAGSIIYFVMANLIQVEFFPYFMAMFWVLLGVADGLVVEAHAYETR